MLKVINEVFSGDTKITIGYSFTKEDAFKDLKKAIEAKGGEVYLKKGKNDYTDATIDITINIKEISLYKYFEEVVFKYLKDIESIDTPLDNALRDYGKRAGLDAQFVNKVIDNKKPSNINSKTKYEDLVSEKITKALSTWDFKSIGIARLNGIEVNLVGQSYRKPDQQLTLAAKRVNNMALLVAEPDNPNDINAVMVLMWSKEFEKWQHVGYVKASQAMMLRGKWVSNPKKVAVARITSINDYSYTLTLTGEIRTYPNF